MTMMRHIVGALGVAVVIGCGPLAHADANLVLNGNFETGDFTNWTVDDPNNPPTDGPGVNITIDTSPYPGDSYDASLGTTGTTGTLSQTIVGLTVGATYTISFELADPGGSLASFDSSSGDEELLDAAFGGDAYSAFDSTTSSVPFAIEYGPGVGAGYISFGFTSTATSTSENLTITEENDDTDFLLDDVSVTPQATTSVPEPSSAVLILTGLAAFAARRRRRRS
jgi:hypothetical protein